MNAVVGTDLRAIARAVRDAQAARPGVALAIATLVAVEGSSYRQPGARLLVDADARVLGGAISGGCLEGDVAERAKSVCALGNAIVLRYDLREDLETIWGFGAGCDGIAHVLLEPLSDSTWLFDAVACSDSRDTGVAVTVVRSAHTAIAAGLHLLLNDESMPTGSTAAVHDPVQAISELSKSAQPLVSAALRTRRIQSDDILVDGSVATILVEPVVSPFALHIVGAGRGAEAFAAIATTLGWVVSVIDHRPALLAELVLPATVRRLVRRPEDGVRDLANDVRTAVALLTHIFDIDAQWLREVLPGHASYVGVLGSRERATRLLKRLTTDGVDVTTDMRRKLYAPIGLDLGGESPEAIALASIAEIEAVLHGRPGGPLRERRSPIHTRTPTPLTHAHDDGDEHIAGSETRHSTLSANEVGTMPRSALSQSDVAATIDQCVVPLDSAGD